MVDHSPIVSPEALHARLGSPDLRVVDVRWVMGSPGAGRLAYEAGHLPGAIFLDLDIDLAAPDGPGRHPLPSPSAFRALLESVGIGDGDEVVAYDDARGSIAARLWWMLDDLGHSRAGVLEGGLPAWVAAGFPLTTEVPEPRPRGRLSLRDAWTNVIDRSEVAAGLGEFVLLDARAGPRYRGEVEPIDAVPGHIPTARNAPIDGNVGPDGRLLSPGALAERFESLGAGRAAGRVVTSCGSGVTATFNSLAMRIAGLPDPILYPGSYSDWSRAGMPIAVGPEPGEPPADQPAAPTDQPAAPVPGA
jgi:thiosulfate/3-mercaptopyruvate sulfurtransferase